jgi:hypothetical protein
MPRSSTRFTALFSALFASIFLLGILSDALASHPACKSARIDVAGSYDSNWGPVHLEQSGDRITGHYECCGGGRITGTLKGSTIDYEWQQPGATGHGRWEVVDRGDKLLGTWGTGASLDSGGVWDLERRRPSSNAILVTP